MMTKPTNNPSYSIPRERMISEATTKALRAASPFLNTANPEETLKVILHDVQCQIPDATDHEGRSALNAVPEHSQRDIEIATVVERIGARHAAPPDESVGDLLERAAAAGDEEAKALLKPSSQ